MARPLRIEYSGAFYHVYTRGIERRTIFKDKKDFEKFCAILETVQRVTAFICHSYCLMPNHYHLYLETPQSNLSKIMQEVNGKYTQYFNRRHKRVGPLFQGRFKAKVVDKDSYSQQLCRYIHLNPVKAKLCGRPARWQWSSYGAFMGEVRKPSFLEIHWLLEQIGGRSKFESFTRNGLADNWDPLDYSGDVPVMGSEEFIETIKGRVKGRKKDASLTGLRSLQKDGGVREVMKYVEAQSCDEKTRKKLLIYGLRCYTGLSLRDVGQKLGGMNPVAVSQAVRRFRQDADDDKKLSTLIRALSKKCQM